MGFGSPLQKIAMGMVIVALTTIPEKPEAAWQEYDLLPNPIGWILVLLGVVALARANEAFASIRWLAVLAGLVSVPMWFPQVSHPLDISALWVASLPQIAFCLVLAREIGVLGMAQSPSDGYVAKRFGLLVWGFAVLAVLPVVIFGGGLGQIKSATALAALLVNIAFIYYLFRVHRREWLGGPGPLEIHPRASTTEGDPDSSEGRPPSS